MNEVQLRVPLGLADRLVQEVHRAGCREAVVFALASHASAGDRDLILVRDVIVPPESAYLPSNGHGARWSGAYTIELLNRAIEAKLGLFICHAHGRCRRVQLSSDDESSARTLLPKFQLVAPDRPHGSIVLGDRSVSGVVLMPRRDDFVDRLTLRLFGMAPFTWPLHDCDEDALASAQRQPVADGLLQRRTLRAATVAVVGLSGGGSQLISHLATFGIGEIIGIDDQRADGSNQFASPNIGWLDAWLRARKTTSARLRTWLVNRQVRFTPVVARVPEPIAVEALKRADVIVGCINNLHGRSDINEIALRNCIPYVDIGLSLRVDTEDGLEPPRIRAIAGNVITSLPGGPCLWCSGFVSNEKLDAETGGRGRAYLEGKDSANAFVSGFNGTLAAEAANEVLRLLTGIRDRNEYKRVYDGFSGTIFECSIRPNDKCGMCGRHLAAGDPVWRTAAA